MLFLRNLYQVQSHKYLLEIYRLGLYAQVFDQFWINFVYDAKYELMYGLSFFVYEYQIVPSPFVKRLSSFHLFALAPH